MAGADQKEAQIVLWGGDDLDVPAQTAKMHRDDGSI